MPAATKVKPTGATDPSTGKNLRFRYRPGTSDEKAYAEIFTHGAYRKKKLGFDVEPGETWIDIGGHIGLFALYAISRGAKRVHVYEADAANFAMLEANVELNGLAGRVTCSRAAVVADAELGRRRTIDLWSSSNPSVNYRNSVVPKPRGTKQAVPARRFNAVIAKHRGAAGLKIDIEGAEVPILTSRASEYGALRKLTFEFTLAGGKLPEAQRVLRAKGFQVDIPPSKLKTHAGAWVDYVVHATRPAATAGGGGKGMLAIRKAVVGPTTKKKKRAPASGAAAGAPRARASGAADAPRAGRAWETLPAWARMVPGDYTARYGKTHPAVLHGWCDCDEARRGAPATRCRKCGGMAPADFGARR